MATVFQHLLLATEHSEFDSGAEALAMALARRCQLPLAGVLPIVSNPEFETAAPALAARADQQAAARIAELHELAQAQGVSLALQARRGPEPYQEIVDEARDGERAGRRGDGLHDGCRARLLDADLSVVEAGDRDVRHRRRHGRGGLVPVVRTALGLGDQHVTAPRPAATVRMRST